MIGPIKVAIRVGDRESGTASSLYRWLALDPQVRRDAVVSITPAPPGSGEMGGALDLIDVVLSNGIAVGSLLVAITSWRRSRPRPPAVRFEGDGFSIVIEDASPETVRKIVEALNDRPPPPSEGEDDGAV